MSTLSSTSSTLTLAKALIACPSMTPTDAGCQRLLSERLAALGFTIHTLPFGAVHNLWARKGVGEPLVVFAGHTDVVPPGPLEAWRFPPFTSTVSEGMLYGRGAADMKGSLAAMVTACEQFIAEHPDHPGSIGFLVTSDEEGEATDGTVKVVEWLTAQGIQLDYCLVGEPSSDHHVGDTLKIGRRGSLSGVLKILGQQGHVAYPDKADNPIHRAAPVLSELVAMNWGTETGFQLSNIHAGTGAGNVIPGMLECHFNFRFSQAVMPESLQARVEAIVARHALKYELQWTLSARPFLTQAGVLRTAVCRAVREIMGIEPMLSTAGGTSDGRFIAPTGCEVIEIGPCNATIHQVNECVCVQALEDLSRIYQRVLALLLT